MKLVVDKDMKNNSYHVTLQVLDITDTDREKISDFGELTVDVGGIIKGQDVEQIYSILQVPKTETKLVDVLDPITESPILDSESKPVQKEVTVPVLGEDSQPIMEDKLDEFGKPVWKLQETPVEVVLADLGKELVKFPSDFPIKRTFAVTEYGDKAEEIALAYIELVKAELTAKIADLAGKTDTFSGKVEYQL